jgi:hypothetical protein
LLKMACNILTHEGTEDDIWTRERGYKNAWKRNQLYAQHSGFLSHVRWISVKEFLPLYQLTLHSIVSFPMQSFQFVATIAVNSFLFRVLRMEPRTHELKEMTLPLSHILDTKILILPLFSELFESY